MNNNFYINTIYENNANGGVRNKSTKKQINHSQIPSISTTKRLLVIIIKSKASTIRAIKWVKIKSVEIFEIFY